MRLVIRKASGDELRTPNILTIFAVAAVLTATFLFWVYGDLLQPHSVVTEYGDDHMVKRVEESWPTRWDHIMDRSPNHMTMETHFGTTLSGPMSDFRKFGTWRISNAEETYIQNYYYELPRNKRTLIGRKTEKLDGADFEKPLVRHQTLVANSECQHMIDPDRPRLPEELINTTDVVQTYKEEQGTPFTPIMQPVEDGAVLTGTKFQGRPVYRQTFSLAGKKGVVPLIENAHLYRAAGCTKLHGVPGYVTPRYGLNGHFSWVYNTEGRTICYYSTTDQDDRSWVCVEFIK